MKATIWHGCYSDSWQGVIVPDAFAHPAKFARGLIRRIYSHMRERGYIAPGDRVIDPFGGIAAGALDAMSLGLHWYGCELEPRFVALGNANIEKWRRDLAMLGDGVGGAYLLQGDSRYLASMFGPGMAATRSSPPYETDALGHSRGQAGLERDKVYGTPPATEYGSAPGQLGAMRSGDFAAAVSSPPFGEQQSGGGIGAALQGKGDYEITTRRPSTNVGYTNQADSPGNLAALRADDAGFAAAVSSPPYADAVNGTGEGPGARHDTVHHNGDNAFKASSDSGYGASPGNVGHMRDAGFEAAVTSPPYAQTHVADRDAAQLAAAGNARAIPDGAANGGVRYGSTAGQLGNDTGDTFWTAARAIVEQTYAALRPGGYAAWVCKDFVRKGQRVPFSDQWEQLCAAVGFVPVERIAAMLVEEHGTQLDIFGNGHARRKERKSFFRRLAEAKGSPRIDHEDVLILRKPSNGFRHDYSHNDRPDLDR